MQKHVPFNSNFRDRHYVCRGFMLIELLVVIAIIWIMATILFPVFARARENGRRSSCQSNLKQIGSAVAQYTQDYDEYWPWALTVAALGTVNTPNESYQWMNLVYPYIKNTQVFTCPSDPNKGRNGYWTAARNINAANSAVSYNANRYLLNNDGNRRVAPFGRCYGSGGSLVAHVTKDSAIESPVDTVAVFDAKWGWLRNTHVPNTVNYWDGTTGVMPIHTAENGLRVFQEPGPSGAALVSPGDSSPTERHLNTVNVLFCDGHVKALCLEKFNETTATGTRLKYFTIQSD